MNIYIQYAFIIAVVVFAMVYLVRLFKDTFSTKKKNKCGGSNCKCGGH